VRGLGTTRRVRSQHLVLELILAATLAGALAWALRRASPEQAAVYGVVVLFVALHLDDYYWAILALVPLGIHGLDDRAAHTRGDRDPVAGERGHSDGSRPTTRATAAVRYVVYSLWLWVLFTGWLIAAGRGIPNNPNLQETS
jgi:hypothetical protein